MRPAPHSGKIRQAMIGDSGVIFRQLFGGTGVSPMPRKLKTVLQVLHAAGLGYRAG
jgi:hypothetical protein